MLASILRDLQQPEYVHTLLNPLPIYGLGVALAGLILALISKSRPAEVTALALVFISAAAAWPTARFGEHAYNNILTLADEDGRAWLEAHAERAESLLYAYYCLAALAAAAIFLPRKWRRSARPLAVATLIFAVVSLGAGASIAYAGGKIRHREFRTVPPPEKKPTAQRG